MGSFARSLADPGAIGWLGNCKPCPDVNRLLIYSVVDFRRDLRCKKENSRGVQAGPQGSSPPSMLPRRHGLDTGKPLA